MAKYRKRPIVIETSQWFKNGDHPQDNSCPISPEYPALSEGEVVRYYRTPDCDGQTECKYCGRLMHNHGWIDTLEGGHIVCPSDWIITGVKGERYPIKDDIFQATYEVVEERMTKRIFSIEWPDDLGPMWMNKDNLLLCLNAYCKNTSFVVKDVTDTIGAALSELGVPTDNYPAPVANAVELLRQVMSPGS